MKTVYIASPYTKGDVALNVRDSIEAAEMLNDLGYLPFVPLLSHFWHLMFPHPYEFWMAMDQEWVLKCDAVLRLPGESYGADQEVALALRNNIPVYFSVSELVSTLVK